VIVLPVSIFTKICMFRVCLLPRALALCLLGWQPAAGTILVRMGPETHLPRARGGERDGSFAE
jgi:hypothetical protein